MYLALETVQSHLQRTVRVSWLRAPSSHSQQNQNLIRDSGLPGWCHGGRWDQPYCRNNLLALIRAVTTSFPTTLCSTGSKLASHKNLWITVEHGSATIVHLYTAVSLSVTHQLQLLSFLYAFFSLCFLPHAVSSWLPPPLPLTGSERRFICKRQQNNKATPAPSIPSICSSPSPNPLQRA